MTAKISCYIAVMAFVIGGGSGWASEESQEQRVGRLVAQLADDSFAARERATEQLIRIGLPAAEALEAGLRQPDREVRYRAERILVIIRELDFRRRLDTFLSEPERADELGLPSWNEYRDRVGDGAEARQLFVEMQKAEPDMLAILARERQDPENQPGVDPHLAKIKMGLAAGRAATAIADRCQELNRALQHTTERREPALGSIATLLFAAGTDEVAIDQSTSTYLYQFCYQNAFRSAIAGGPQSQLMRQLLASWIRRSDDWTAYQGMLLAMQYDLKEGLEPAVRTLANGNAAPMHARVQAIQAVTKFGSEEHVDLLEQQLDDKLPYGGTQKINNVDYQTQIRDIALAALWCLVKEDPKDHGFDHLRPSPQTSFDASSVGFPNDASRQKAVAAWREFRAKKTSGGSGSP